MLETPVKQRVGEQTAPVLPYKTIIRPATEVEYPESDGKPMAETDVHRDLMTDALLHPLKERFRQEDDVYVSGNIFLYYEEGNRSAVVAPDVFVVFGVPNRQRRIYQLWEEGKAPDVVFELTSESTYREDLSDKRLVYEALGVREYFLFDPLRDYLRPPLQGFRLAEFYYRSVMPEPWSEGEWQIHSHVLDLTIRTDGPTLRLYDPAPGRYLLSRAEEAEARRLAEVRASEETKARRLAEVRASEEAKARHLAETRAEEAETENVRLRAMLARQDSQS